MKFYQTLFFVFFLSQVVSAQSSVKASSPLATKPNGSKIIDTFEDDSLGDLPKEWYNRDGKIKPAENAQEASLFRYYITEQMGNKYLRYEGTKARHLNFPLKNRPDINIYETPILSWKWRVEKLPERGNEEDDDFNDTAASIYVVFDMGRVALFKKVPKSIRYTWSTTLKKGTQLSKFFGNQKIIVVESGSDRMGHWVSFKRNIVKDYKRLFGDDPPKTPLAILILSDGDNTQSRVVAGYDDIELKPE
ncbi:MAG: DUF3047 domain-containing protein [Balneolaceae bacterium]|jgi:hypothetical protein